MGSERYYEIIAENTRNGSVEKRVILCRSAHSPKNRDRAMREFEALRRAGFNLIRTQYIEVKTEDVEWLSYGNA